MKKTQVTWKSPGLSCCLSSCIHAYGNIFTRWANPPVLIPPQEDKSCLRIPWLWILCQAQRWEAFLPWVTSEPTSISLSIWWSSKKIQKNLFSQYSSLAHFLIGSFIFLELSCRSYLYIFEINPLSVALFAIIFSQSEDCLFTLLIVSFVVK